MVHIALLGDSIFDNTPYVGVDGIAVIEHLRRRLPNDWKASLAARDGSVTTDVPTQVSGLPNDITHLALSIGGNDALRSSNILFAPATSVGDALRQFAEALLAFRERYRQALASALSLSKPIAVCTIYDAIPGLPPERFVALKLFNDVIVREIALQGCAIIDLRSVCDEANDVSAISPIEPSSSGGAKIAHAIASVVRALPIATLQSMIHV